MTKPFGTPAPKLFDKEEIVEPTPISDETQRELQRLSDYLDWSKQQFYRHYGII